MKARASKTVVLIGVSTARKISKHEKEIPIRVLKSDRGELRRGELGDARDVSFVNKHARTTPRGGAVNNEMARTRFEKVGQTVVTSNANRNGRLSTIRIMNDR